PDPVSLRALALMDLKVVPLIRRADGDDAAREDRIGAAGEPCGVEDRAVFAGRASRRIRVEDRIVLTGREDNDGIRFDRFADGGIQTAIVRSVQTPCADEHTSAE